MFPERRGDASSSSPSHYARVGPRMAELLRDRPLTFQVFPDGIEGEGYYMKSMPRHFPDWIGSAKVAKRGGSLRQVVARDAATFVYLAGQNVITTHAWLSRADRPREPDRLIVDFDPSPGAGFAAVRAAARDVGRAAPRRRARDVRDGHRLARRPRRLPAAAGHGFGDVHKLRSCARRSDGRRRSQAPDARVEEGRPRLADLRRRQPDQLRPARRRALRRPRPPRTRRSRCRSSGTSSATAA